MGKIKKTDYDLNYFEPHYEIARDRFRKAVHRRRAELVSLPLAAMGPIGVDSYGRCRKSDLTVDIGWVGASKPRRVFVHSSGLHGVEAFAGSAIQRHWMKEGLPPIPGDSAIVIVHVLNPYGAAWLRRFNENNVDLNRNFREPGEYTPDPPPYWTTVNAFLNPRTPPGRDWFYLRAAWLVLRHGMPTLRQAVAGGQCLNPKGLFFAGSALEEGPTKFQAFMAARLAEAQRIVAVDVHTGLGRFGEDRLLVDARYENTDAFHSMRGTFGDRLERLTKEGIAYSAKGAHQEMYFRSFPHAQVYFMSQEFGTYRPLRVLAALRAENRALHYGTPVPPRFHAPFYPPRDLGANKAELFEVFNPKSGEWRLAVLARGRQVIRQGLALAFGESHPRGSS